MIECAHSKVLFQRVLYLLDYFYITVNPHEFKPQRTDGILILCLAPGSICSGVDTRSFADNNNIILGFVSQFPV